jgi:hypothetical protein
MAAASGDVRSSRVAFSFLRRNSRFAPSLRENTAIASSVSRFAPGCVDGVRTRSRRSQRHDAFSSGLVAQRSDCVGLTGVVFARPSHQGERTVHFGSVSGLGRFPTISPPRMLRSVVGRGRVLERSNVHTFFKYGANMLLGRDIGWGANRDRRYLWINIPTNTHHRSCDCQSSKEHSVYRGSVGI